MKLAFLASHRGSNMQSVLDACRDGRIEGNPVLLICNNRGAEAIARAERHGFPALVLNGFTHPEPAALDAAMADALKAHGAELVVLAGYMKKIGPRVLGAFSGRILNIHPALLPRYGGQGMYGEHVHRAVLAAGDTASGVTVHLVNEHYDRGRILAQRKVPVLPEDTPSTLAARVLEAEHEVLVDTVGRICSGEIRL
jgi:phosphoribosylglycinamide formyltransferase-1